MRERNVNIFLSITLVLAAICGIAVRCTDRFALHLAMNGCHGPVGDTVFPWLTELANGLVPVLLSVAMLFKSWRSFLMMGLSTGLSALLAQFLKRMVFSGHDRPGMFLDRMQGLHTVAGVDLHHHFSFPSGHSTAAFSMCLALAVIIGTRPVAAALAVLAAVLAYSRVYLSQHFTEDILAGALLGSAVATGVYWLLYRSTWAESAFLDRAPLRRQNQ